MALALRQVPQMKRRAIAILLVSLLGTAAAKAADPAAARSLFYEARALMGQYRWSEACPKLDESLRLDPGIGTAFNLADCNEHLGKLATAWTGFLQAAEQSRAAKQLDREKLARKRAQTLEPRLPNLVIEVSSAPRGLEIKRDGALVAAADWNTPAPVDPGTHVVSVSAPGKQPLETTVESVEGKTVRVSVPSDLRAAPAVDPTLTTTHDNEPATTTTTAADALESYPPPIIESSGPRQRTIGWVVTGLGVVGLGGAAGFGLWSLSKRGESQAHCVVNACDPTGLILRDDAIRNGNIATIAAIAGGAAVAGGLLLVFTAPSSTEPRRSHGKTGPGPSARVVIGGSGFVLKGAF